LRDKTLWEEVTFPDEDRTSSLHLNADAASSSSL